MTLDYLDQSSSNYMIHKNLDPIFSKSKISQSDLRVFFLKNNPYWNLVQDS